jgi:uncharacterized protein YqeY
MDLKATLEGDLKAAMRTHDEVRRRTIRMVLSAVKLAEIEKGAKLEEPALLTIVQKEIKSRNESISDAERANRPDLIQDNLAEIQILETYLPKQMDESELRTLIQSVITEIGATGPADMGKVIKTVLPKVQGRAPNDRVSLLVRQLLQI